MGVEILGRLYGEDILGRIYGRRNIRSGLWTKKYSVGFMGEEILGWVYA